MFIPSRHSPHFPAPRRAAQRGFTLIEMIAAIAIIAIGLPAVAYTFMIAMQQDGEASLASQAQYLATSLMSEISNRHVTKAATVPSVVGYDRRSFNEISNYNIFKNTWGALSPPRDETGASMAQFSSFSQYVEVENVGAPSASGSGRTISAAADGSTDFKMVTVTIQWLKGKRQMKLSKVFAVAP